MKIGIVAVSSRFSRERAEAIEAWMELNFPARKVAVVIHPVSVVTDRFIVVAPERATG
jgi:muramoyltetrapeptide carboxypeptidase